MNLFSGGNAKDKQADKVPASSPARRSEDEPASKAAPKGEVKDLENFVDYVVKTLVDKPESVRISRKEAEEGASVIEIVCAKEDMGKVIGKSGKTIMAIRSLVSGAGGRLGRRVSVEIVE